MDAFIVTHDLIILDDEDSDFIEEIVQPEVDEIKVVGTKRSLEEAEDSPVTKKQRREEKIVDEEIETIDIDWMCDSQSTWPSYFKAILTYSFLK